MIWYDSPKNVIPGPVALQQDPGYARACKALGAQVLSLQTGPVDAPIGRVQVLSRRIGLVGPVAQVLRGPVWADWVECGCAKAALRGLADRLRLDHRAVLISCEPLKGASLAPDGLLQVMSGAMQARLCLQADPETRLSRQHAKWRNRLRKAQQADLRVEHAAMPDDPGHWLFQKEVEMARARRFRPVPTAFPLAWRRLNGARSTRLFVARGQGRDPLAAMLFLLHGPGATYQIGWTGEAGRAVHAHNLLLWEAANWLSARGHHWIDLGGLDTQNAPGLARFKLGSGATPMQLGPTCLDTYLTRSVARLCQPRVVRAPRFQPERG